MSAADPMVELRTVYQELCTSYRAIDDFRAKLLGFLPLASGTGIFLLLGGPMGEAKGYLLPVGVFGFLITLGLLAYEIYGIKKCVALIEAGKQLERKLAVTDGQFSNRPSEVARLINKPFASGIIYSSVLAAWSFLALIGAPAPADALVAILVFIISLCSILRYDLQLRNDIEKR